MNELKCAANIVIKKDITLSNFSCSLNASHLPITMFIVYLFDISKGLIVYHFNRLNLGEPIKK